MKIYMCNEHHITLCRNACIKACGAHSGTKELMMENECIAGFNFALNAKQRGGSGRTHRPAANVIAIIIIMYLELLKWVLSTREHKEWLRAALV
jgi:hypothetical protein